MCEWSGHNVRVNMECASDWLICASRNVRVVRSQCASEHGMCEYGDVRLEMCEFEYSDVRVIGYVRVVWS